MPTKIKLSNLDTEVLTQLTSIDSAAIVSIIDATAIDSAGVQAIVDGEISSLINGAPAELDTLDQLAAAINDDADFSTTVNNSIATKLPLSGGTMTGAITFAAGQSFDGRDVSSDGTKLDGIEASADVTDVTNVTAAGALMRTGGTMTGNLILNADPTNALGAATKEYVDTIAAAGIHYHTPVRVESPINLNATYDNGTAGVGATLTNAGTQAAISIDGVALDLNDRVLVYEQSDATENGIYTVTTVGDGSSNWVLTRAQDADSYSSSDPDALGEGDAFFVKEGDTGAGELYVMNTSGTITFGTTDITFTVIAETAVFTAGTGLTLDGTQFNIDGTVLVDGDIGTSVQAYSSVLANTTASYTTAEETKLSGIEASADVTDVTNVTAAGALMTTGGSVTGDVSFGDNDKAIFGAGSDLQIYHDGGDSWIVDDGTGGLKIGVAGTGTSGFYKGTGSETIATFEPDGPVTLYHNNAAKLATTTTGIDVTGTVTADGLTVDGNPVISNGSPQLFLQTGATHYNWQIAAQENIDAAFEISSGNIDADATNDTYTKRFLVEQSGDISFYEDTGTTPKFHWDASAQSVTVTALDNATTTYPINIVNSTGSLTTGYGAYGISMPAGSEYTMDINGDLILDTGGNVGIGTSSPSQALDVVGNIAVTGTVDGRDIATNIPSSLGTAGQVLTVNSGATAAEWATAAGGGGGAGLFSKSKFS